MPFDPTLLTDPQTANAFGPQIQAATQAANQSAQLAAQAQRQMQKEHLQSQRAAETAANEAAKAAAQQAKDSAAQARTAAKEIAAQEELKMRRANRPFFTNAMGQIVPTQDDATFAEEQQRKQAQAAEKLRQETVEKQMQSIKAEAGVRGSAMREKERADLEKQLSETRDGARYNLLSKLDQTGKETDKAGWYDVVNNNPTPAALTAQQRAQRLADPNAELDDTDLADLEADPTTQPTAARLKALKQSLTADDEIRSYQKQTQQKLAELALLKADPARYDAYQREKMSKMDAATLDQHLSTTQEDLTRRAAELDAKRAAYEQPILATQAKFTELQRQNAEAVKQGVPAAELVTLEDGTHWHAPLYNEVSRLQAEDDARRTDPEQEKQRQLLELEAADYNRQVNLLNEAGGLRQQKTATEAKTQADVRRFTPGMERSAQQVEQIKASAQQRIEAVNAQFPQDGPERQAAMQAIEADVTAQAQEAEAKGQQTQAAAMAAYQGIKQRLYTNPELKSVAGDLFVTARKNLAQALGIPEAEANNLLEDMESQDWSQIQGKHGETVPEGNAAQRFMTEASGDKRQFRVLKNGGLIINPQISDPEAYAKAVEAAPASPEAKAAAMARQPDLRQRYGAQALETLQQIKAADWEKFRASQPKDLSPEEVAARYADKLKADTGTGEKVLRAIFQSMAQGLDDIGSQVLGGLSGITGSETLMKGATALNERSQLIEMDKQMRGAGGNFALDTLGQFSRLVPSLAPAAGGAKAAQVGLALFARTGIAARMLPGLVQGLRTASTPAQAARAAQMFSRAGLTGAAAAGGAQTYGAQLADIYAQLRHEHPEMDHATALRQAQIPAILSGAMTTALTIAGGATGVEKLLANPAAAKEAFKKQFTSRMAQAGFIAKAVALGGVKEWPEEIADELFSTITSAAATGQSVPQALAQFAESLPELSAAIFMLGGVGEGIQAARDSSMQAPPANIDATQPDATAGAAQPQAAPPEVIEAAWASIENLDLPGVDPAEIEPMQTRASVALAVAQGGSIEDMEEDQLNAVGWTGRNSKGQTLPPGQIEKLKDYTGPEVLEVDTKGNASVSPRYLTALQQHLPPVAAAISASLSPTPATPSAQATAPATTPEADTQARRVSVDGAASPATGGGGVTQAGAGAVSPAPAAGSSTFPEDTPESERSSQLATHLSTLGLPPDQASAVADHLVEKQGVIGTSYLEQVIASDFPKALKALGITGSLSAAQSATNPLRAPADLSQRLASQKTAKAVTEDSPVTEQPTTVNEPQAPEPLSTAQPAASPAPSRPKLDLVQEDRAQQLAAKLTRGGAYTDEEAVALAEEYVSKSAENGRALNDQWRYGLIPWLAARETAARGGRLAKGKMAVENIVEATPDRPADLRRHPAWARNRLAALSSLPAARRPAARQQLNALERALAANHALFSSIALGPKEIARSIIGEGSMAVQEMDGQIVLALDLGRMLAQMKNTTTPEAGMTASLVEEAIHAAVLRLAKKNPAKYGLPALVKRWQALTPELRQKVWESYHAVDIQNGTHSKTIPADMKDGQQWALMNEFLRMLVQDQAFAGQVSEVAAQDRNLAQWIVDALKDLAQALKDLIAKASPEVQTELNSMVDEIALTVKQFQALSAAQPFGKQPSTTVNNRQQSSTAPAPLATATDNRASVLSASQEPGTKNEELPAVRGASGTAYTDANEPIEYQWAVVDVNSLKISNRDDGTISPDYPQELQPRDRTTPGSEAQVADIAKNFNLDRLSTSSSVGDGAPIIGQDSAVESGNGRAMGGRRAYATGNAASSKYRAALIARAAEFGLNREQVEAVANPMLVRIRTTEVNRVAFVLAANVSTIAPKRELEQAKIDAKQIVPDLFEGFVPSEDGEVFTAANAGFIRDFISAIVPPAERPAIMDAKGNLSQSGLRRLRNALFVYAYGDDKATLAALGTLTEDIEADGRNLVNTLIAIAPRFAEQNGRIAAGALYPLSITEDLAKALTTYQDIKARGDTVDSWAAQDTLAGIGERPSDFQRTLVTALHEHRRKPRVLLAALDRYAKAIDGAGDPKQASLFGEEPRPTREELFALATGKTFTQEEVEGWRKLAEQPSTAPVATPPPSALRSPPAPVTPQPPSTAQPSTSPVQESIRPLSTVEAARLLQQKTGLTDRDALAKAIETRLSLRPFAAQSMAEAILNDLAGTAAPKKRTPPAQARPLSEADKARMQFLADQRAGITPRNWEDSPWMDEAEYRRYAGGNARRMSLAKATTAIDWPGRPHIWKGSTTGGASMAILRRTPGGDYDIQIENDFSIWPAKNVMSITGLKKAELAALPDFPGRESPAIAPKNALKLYRTLTAQQKTKPLTAGQSKALEQAERSLGQLFLFDDAETSILKPAEDLVLEQQTTGRLVKNPEQLTLFMGNKALARPEESEWYQKNKARFDAEAEIFGTPPSAYIRAAFQAETNTGYTIDPLNPPSPWPDAAPPDFVNGKFTDWEQKVRDWEQRKADLSWSNTKVWFSGPLWYVTNYTYSGESSYVTYDSPIGQQQFRISNHAKPKDHATNQYFRLQYVGDSRAEAREWIKEKVLAAPDLNLKNREQAEAVQRLANERWTQARQTQNNEGQANQQLQELTFLYKTPRSLEIWKQWADEGFYSQAIPYDKVGLGQKSPATPSKLEKFRHLIRQKELKWAEKSQSTQATVLNAPEEQLALFMATKRSLYSKAAKEKHLRPITRMLVKLRSGVQDALIRTVAETVLPRMSPPIRALMDQAAAEYDGWLKPKMAALKPQWDAYKARYTPAIVDAYNEGLESLAAELGIMPMTRVPLKGDRGMEKAILDAEDESTREGRTITPDVTRVNDVLRASLVAADDEGVARAVAALRARYKVVKFKDRFNKPAGGYHDWNFIIEVAPGLNAEVQIHRIDYLFSKELGPGHLMYEDWRRLDRLVKLNPAPEIARQHRRLSKAMEAYYTAIAQAFNMARKESSSISTPSLSTRPESAMALSSPDRVPISGTGGSPSMSQETGSPSTSKNLVVGENVSGTFTPDTTTQTPNKQGVTITTANIADYAGAVDVTALQGRQKDWKQAFDYQPGGLVAPLSKLISHKNELEDPKFKAGLKKDPRQNAADWILKAMQGEPGAKKRAPLDVSTNPDGTYTIRDGNATAQALMLAGWKAVPINVVQAPALQKGRTAVDDTPDLFSFNTGLGLDTLLTPAQKERKLADSQQLDLFGDFTDARPRSTSQRSPQPARPSRTAKPAQTAAGLGDLFGQTGMAPSAGGNRPLDGELPGLTGGSGGGGANAAGGGTTRQPGADTAAGEDSQGSPGADMPGLPGDAGDSDAVLTRPSVGDPARNFEVPDNVENLAPATDKAKILANIEAIRLLKQLEDERRNATPEEKTKLAAYTGWGAFKEAFNSKYEEDIADIWDRPGARRQYMPDWLQSWEKNHRPLHKLLRENMTEDEFASASASTLNAHYTAAPIIRAMWKMVEKLGFTGGRALEPSAGAGHYLGLTPAAIADKTQWQTVELDDLSARLLSKLYPEATVNESRGGMEGRLVSGLGFERARIPNGSLDLIISNVPFHESGPKKKGFPNLNLHNFFFAHALDKVKPGGLVAFITSESTMQNNMKQRDFIASKGDLVAAFRLPNNAFKGNAGTEVTTDIIILRKPDGKPFQGKAWRNLVEVGRQTITLVQGKEQTADELRREAERTGEIIGKEYFKGGKKAIDVSAPIMVNEYFVNHPQHALGTHTLASTMYRAGGYALVAPDGLDVPAALDALVPSLPENVMGTQPTAAKERRLADREDKPFSFKEQDGKIFEVQPDGSMEEADWSTNPDMVKTWRSWKRVSLAVEELVTAENSDGASDETIEDLRRALNVAYDTHIATHKPVSRRFANAHKHLASDPGYPLTAALENEVVTVDPKTVKKTYSYKKAEIFTKRIGRPIVIPTKATSVDEALEMSLAWKGHIDPAYGASLLGSTVERFEVEALQRPDIFRNPETGTLEQGEEYLSGNVRQKLEAAQEAAKDDPAYQRNVEALTNAQPERKEIASISPILGARWIPAPVYNAFIKEVLQGNDTVEYIPAGNSWIVSGSGVYSTEEHGTERAGPFTLFKHALNMTEPLIYDGKGENRTFNPSATAAAKVALDKMRRAFIDFVKTSDVQVTVDEQNIPVWQATEDAFNETNNSYVTPKHTGAYLKFPGLNTDYVYTKAHRRGVIARFLTTRRGMMAHGVGSGKTFNQIILAQEMRRLGLAKKPMIVVQNSTLGQFAKSYLKAYPAAKILVPTKADFQAQNRRKLVAKIATGNWDAIILPHSQFDLISNKDSAVKAYMDSQIDELMAIVNSTKDKAKVRDLEGMIKRLKDRRQGMLDQLKDRQDTAVMWEDLGIDALIMDEAHNYKSLPIITRMGRVKGVPASGDSQRAINFMLKCRDVQSRTGGKNIFLATGTPIKNSMAEAYIMMQFMAPDILEAFHIHNFDDFATTYGQTVTEAEMAWGGTPKMETRFAKFQNGSALVTMIRTMFDVAFGNDKLGLDVPKIKGGEPEMVIVPATGAIDQFNAWVRNVSALWKDADSSEKEEFTAVPIQTMAAGIAAALDPRLLAPNLPDDPGSKVNEAIRRVSDIYKAGMEKKTTQIIFSDLRNPFSMDYLMPFTGHPFPDQGSTGEFDLYADIQRKLIASGVPAKEIHLMKSGMTDTAKAALFEKVDAGEIRIIIGSTELLGVGVNIQTRLKAVHHLMPPRDFTPAMMEQRNGRIIRQGNLHAEKVEGKPAWNEEVEVVNYGTEGSMDSAIYGTLARKQRFITQLLMGEEMQDTFDDPTDPVAVNMAEMAARTLGDPDFIRRIELEKEIKDLRLQNEAFTNELSGKRSRLSRVEQIIRNGPQAIERAQADADRYATIWQRKAPRPEGVREETDISGKSVYEFGGRTIDTARESATTNQLDLWLLDVSKGVERRGLTQGQATLTINGQPLTINVHITLPGQPTGGSVLTSDGRDVTSFNGAASLIQNLRRLPSDAQANVERIRQQLDQDTITARNLRALLASAPSVFPEAERLAALEREAQEVDARLREKSSPPENPQGIDDGRAKQIILPPLKKVEPGLMTYDVEQVIDNADIIGNKLFLPDTLDRKLYKKVNAALESAGGVWSRKDKAHLFAGDPRPYLGLAPMPVSPSSAPALSMGTRATNAGVLAMGKRAPTLIQGIFEGQDDLWLDAAAFTRRVENGMDYLMPEDQRRFSLASREDLRIVGLLFRAIATQPNAFRLQKLTPEMQQARTLDEALRAYQVPLLFTEDEGNGSTAIFLSPPADASEENSGPRRTFSVEARGKDRYHVNSLMGAGQWSTQIYQAIYTWAHNNGFQIVPDTGYTADGAFRRISHMLSSALRHGTLSHMVPHKQHVPALAGIRGSADSFAEDIGILAATEADLSLAKVPELSDWWAQHDLHASLASTSDAATQRLASGLEEIRRQLEEANSSLERRRVGYSTNRRAFLVAHRLSPDRPPRGPGVEGRYPQGRSREPLLTDKVLYKGTVSPSLPVSQSPSPLAKLGWNHLDRAASAKLAALARWTNDTTGAAEKAAQLGDRANRLFMSNKALASPSATAQTPPMASTDGAAQSNELSPGGLSEADARTPMTIYRAGDADEVGVKPFSSWTPEKETAVEYQDNPGFGGETLRQVRVDAGNVLEADTTSRRGMRDLAEALGFEPETGNDWFDNGWRYPWEESSKVKRALEESEFDAVQYTDDFPEGATTIIFTREPKSLNPSRAQSGTLAKATTSPTTVNNGQPSSTAQPSTSPPSPLAKLGWNHLDRAASAKLAALARWTNDTTGAAEIVSKWQGTPLGKVASKYGHALKRELFPASVIPREIAAAQREMEIKAALGAQRGMDLVRALSGSPKFSDIAYPPEFSANPVWRTRLYSAMTGEAPMTSLPPALQNLAAKLRAMLVEIGQEAVKQGRMSLDTFEMLREGYMPHYYQEDVAREKSLIQRFRLSVRDLLSARSSAWHIVDTQNRERGTGDFRAVEWQPGKWRFRNKEHRDAHYEDFILQQAAAQLSKARFSTKTGAPLTVSDLRAPAALSAEARGALDLIKRQLRSRYQKEAPLSIEQHQKAGLIMDPVYAIARYAAQQSHDNATAEFFNFVAAQPEAIADTATAGFTEVPDNPRYGNLAGKFVTDDVANQILEMVEAPGDALRAYDTILGWWKTGKTVLNPGTHVRNVLGNVFFSQLAGNSVWNPGNTRYYRDALRAMRNGGPDLMEAYEQGVLGADFVSVELRQTLRQLLPDPATIEEGKPVLGIGKSIGQFAAKVIGNPAHKAYNQIAALYQAEDELFKLAAYYKAKAIFAQQGTRNEELGTMAAGHVRKWFPYFDSGSSTTLRALGRTAMPFLGFYRESIRIFGHALKERPLALAAGLAVPSIITALSAMALGLDDDELDEIKKDMRGKGGKLLGPTPLGGVPLFSMLLPERSDQGQLQQFDISAIHPFVDFMGNRVEGGEGEDWYQKAWRSFIAAGPIGSLIYSQMTGKDTFGDRTFVEQNMTAGEKIAARADNIAKTLLPPLAPGGTGFQSLLNAGTRQTNKTFETRSPTQTVLRSVVGLDVRNATPDLYRIAEDWRKANGIPTTEGMDFGSTTPASRARKALFAQLAQPEPNLTAIANLKQKLKDMGQPMETDKEIQQLLFYRNPLMIIKGQDNQQRFRASLAPAQRAVLDTAIQEYNQIKARAPMLLRTAK